jgi:hypothetical protein
VLAASSGILAKHKGKHFHDWASNADEREPFAENQAEIGGSFFSALSRHTSTDCGVAEFQACSGLPV